MRSDLGLYYKCDYERDVLEDPDNACSKVVDTEYVYQKLSFSGIKSFCTPFTHTFHRTEAGVYINPKECVPADRVDEIDALFDIPNGIRETGIAITVS